MSIRTQEVPTGPVRRSIPGVPPLEQGDRLTAKEFERRFDAMPGLKKAELIGGRVYMSSPVRVEFHGEPRADAIGWLAFYKTYTPGTQLGADSTVRLDEENEPQPDALLRIRPNHGGRTATVDGYVEGGPELSTEVSASSASYDLHEKLQTFWQHGVQEYMVWRVFDEAIDWFVRGQQQYEALPLENGIYKSRVFPGLWLDANAMITGDMACVLAVLLQGLATPEHAAFCAKLSQAAASAEKPS
jgi:Putative restriction endonuclease